MTDNETLEFRALERTIRKHARAGVATGTCLDELAVADFVSGATTTADRQNVMDHLISCGACRVQVADLNAALQDETIVRALPPVGRSPGRRWTAGPAVIGGLLAATLVFLVLQMRGTVGDGNGAHRDERGALSVAPGIIAPRASISMRDSVVFQWSLVPRADRYRVTVYSIDGVVIWNTETADTAIAMRASPTLVRGTRYLWKVEARTGFDRWTASPLAEFQVSR